jgi:hypothetical protein
MTKAIHSFDRRHFIGGSDARIIMGALHRLWREKRGESAAIDLSGVLIVQLGLVTEDLNRRWYELNSGHQIAVVQRHSIHRTIPRMAPTLHGLVKETERAKSAVKGLMPEVAKEAMGPGIRAKRSKSGAASFDLVEMEASHASLQ